MHMKRICREHGKTGRHAKFEAVHQLDSNWGHLCLPLLCANLCRRLFVANTSPGLFIVFRYLWRMKMTSFLLVLTVLFSLTARAQQDTLQAPYKRFPTLPPIQLLLGDSTTKFTKANLPKNKPVIVMVFSPECSHCRQMAEELPKYRQQLKGVTVVMATMYGLTAMNDFTRTFGLSALPNVVVGKDIYFLLPPFYGAKNLPFLAFYDKKGKLLSVFEGSISIEQIVARVANKG